MNGAIAHPGSRKQQITGLWLAFMALEGIAALAGTLLSPSEAGSAVLFGLSLPRLALAAGVMAAAALLVILAIAAFRQPMWWRRWLEKWDALTTSTVAQFVLLSMIFLLFVAILAVLVLAVSPAAGEFTILRAVWNRMGLLLVWFALVLLQTGGLMLVNFRPALTPFRAGALILGATAVYTIALRVYLTATWDTRFRGLEGYIFLPAVALLVWGIGQRVYSRHQAYPTARKSLLLFVVFLSVYTVYWHTAQWVRAETTRDEHTWHLLAQAILDGHLYLEDPYTTHDMTLFQGRWYVPSPPLPALVLVPFIAVFGIENFNVAQFSIILGTLNAVLVYAMLSRASALKMIPTSETANLWLVVLFALGTNHWWLSVNGVFWYMSQLLTLLFSALAVLLSLHRAAPVWIGLALGIAVLSRPNVFPLWLLLAGVTLFFAWRKEERFPWKDMFVWSAATAAPVAVCVGGLLFYNHLRFHDWLDFGYVTVNSSDWIMSAVQTYGMFNLHFLPANIHTMLFKLPFFGFVDGKITYSPGLNGTSIFAMTPSIIYLFRRFRWNWWTAGAWSSIALTAGMLLLYHNDGSWQLGYRYLMDFILPVLLLIGIGIGSRPPVLFRVLVILSIIINAAGIFWWFTHV